MQTLEETPYPKAGYPNPGVRLFTVRAGGGSPAEIDTETYGSSDHLIVAVAWKPDGSALTYQVQDREQTWLDLDAWSTAEATSRTILRETTRAWVDNDGDPLWLKDGSFLWLSERSGFKHIYRIGADGQLLRQITDGRWEVRTLHGIDPSEQWIYFSGTERSPIGGDVYRIRLDGSGLTRISEAAGTHVAKFNKSMTQFVDSWSDVQTPAQITLRRSDGAADHRLRPVGRQQHLGCPPDVRLEADPEGQGAVAGWTVGLRRRHVPGDRRHGGPGQPGRDDGRRSRRAGRHRRFL